MESRISENKIIGSSIFESIRNYFNSRDNVNQIHYIFVPYIKTDVLEKLVSNLRGKIVIITTWKPEDLLTGISELELYSLCKKLGMTLYLNNQIHMKIYSSGFDDLILSTANVSQRGLGTIPNHNFECASIIKDLTSYDRMYFEQIRKNSIHVDDELYNQLKNWYDKQQKIQITETRFDEIVTIKNKELFLISALPMTKSVQLLQDAYMSLSKGEQISDKETRDCVFHDLANYSLDLGLPINDFYSKLKNEFFIHPFIQKIDQIISPEAYFGRIKEWVQNNCTDVPVPSRRELTGNVQVLLEWFEKLGDGKYIIDVPGSHSQRITRDIR